MTQRAFIISGLLAYAVVLIILLPTGTTASSANGGTKIDEPAQSPAPSLEGLPFRGVGVQIQRVDWIEKYKKVFAQITAIGADTVLLTVDTRQENGKCSRIYLDYRMTPNTEQLGQLIDSAHKQHLRVVLMPLVLLDNPIGGEWRGEIAPDNWDDWWNSYRSMLDVFSSVAQVHHVEMLVVGSELVSTEIFTDEWKKTIQLTRDNYKGLLTYSANFDHYEQVGF